MKGDFLPRTWTEWLVLVCLAVLLLSFLVLVGAAIWISR